MSNGITLHHKPETQLPMKHLFDLLNASSFSKRGKKKKSPWTLTIWKSGGYYFTLKTSLGTDSNCEGFSLTMFSKHENKEYMDSINALAANGLESFNKVALAAHFTGAKTPSLEIPETEWKKWSDAIQAHWLQPASLKTVQGSTSALVSRLEADIN